MKLRTAIALGTLALTATFASAQQQGVSKDEIVIGTIQDLSGPIAGFGKQARNGMQLAVEELNEQGGINGRAGRHDCGGIRRAAGGTAIARCPLVRRARASPA